MQYEYLDMDKDFNETKKAYQKEMIIVALKIMLSVKTDGIRRLMDLVELFKDPESFIRLLYFYYNFFIRIYLSQCCQF